MLYDRQSDKWREECGIFGVFARQENVALNTYWGLYALQHRGQESAGIAVTDGNVMDVQRGMGLVNEVFRHSLPDMPAHIAIGHVRYSTTGSSLLRNTQPLLVNYSGGQISLAHNGNLTNAHEIREGLEQRGSVFQTSMDSEVLVNLIARSSRQTIEEKIVDTLTNIHGAYCLVIMTENKLIGVRDPHGFRPLCLGRLGDGWVLSSESCALDTVGAEFVRDIEPGEMVSIDDKGVASRQFVEPGRLAGCVFEYIYFARPDSVIDGQSVYQARFNMGRTLARESGFKADIVISVPDSGTTAALGYSQESGIPFAEGLMKNRYIGRTFIQPEQKKRDMGVRIKLNAVTSVVKGKSVIMVDDSIVRGTTSGKIVRMLKEAGAKAVHMCVSSPPIGFPCYYGIDISVRKELIAASKRVEEIREFIGADSLHYLSLAGLHASIGNIPQKTLCNACFNCDYPAEIPCERDCANNKFLFEPKSK
ncbi:amidophosphoribosyltransferase [Sporomusa acidovorans]|uniref:Amidophosphoribosyltransferase n=1 Tax=Sporomusa acidovorans (strain ATCC 49682 / DSM 3132 / Mol) TaxID=1123286 RepID=A0ABZ3IZQ2_SPOA4|nr:amidophosphoribosyltransferase [Sporomusa acidovorans]OZC24232.1 amidophosphoribosyltransferase precursor [Sporomusa acidovorans DSM 3132]SDF56388.1 amidophosphoribosyltransferase [Sporomusa acidovorans]